MKFPRATHLVILCEKKTHALEAIQVLKEVFGKLELTMNIDKSKLVNLWLDREGFDFLGFHHRRMPLLKKRGRVIYLLRSHPSKKAMKRMRARVTEETSPRRYTWHVPVTLEV